MRDSYFATSAPTDGSGLSFTSCFGTKEDYWFLVFDNLWNKTDYGMVVCNLCDDHGYIPTYVPYGMRCI